MEQPKAPDDVRTAQIGRIMGILVVLGLVLLGAAFAAWTQGSRVVAGVIGFFAIDCFGSAALVYVKAKRAAKAKQEPRP